MRWPLPPPDVMRNDWNPPVRAHVLSKTLREPAGVRQSGSAKRSTTAADERRAKAVVEMRNSFILVLSESFQEGEVSAGLLGWWVCGFGCCQL